MDILTELRGFDDEVAATVKWSLRRDLLTKLKMLAGASKTPAARPQMIAQQGSSMIVLQLRAIIR